MESDLSGRRVAVLAADGVDEAELTGARQALASAGATVLVLAPHDGEIQAMRGLERAERLTVDRAVSHAHGGEYDALVIPGGVAGVDALRLSRQAVQLVRECMMADKPVAAAGHGPWLLIEADAVRGRTLASSASIRTDIRNAGGTWTDQPVQVDGALVTGRGGSDLPAWCAAIGQRLAGEMAAAAADERADELVEQSFPASDPPPGPVSIGTVHDATPRPRRGEEGGRAHP